MGHTLTIADEIMPPGSRRRIQIPVSRSALRAFLSMPIEIVNGVKDGPRMWLTAAIHGDELNGIEIIRRILSEVHASDLRGCLIAIPIVNVFGFMGQDRYLPDRRDLNRCFPGSSRGSLASQIAYFLMKEVVSKCSHGVDLHTASLHKYNLPQIRTDLDDEQCRICAEAFSAPVTVHSAVRDGSLRFAAKKKGVTTLVYEAGETHRFNLTAIDTGVHGTLRLMHHLGMIDEPAVAKAEPSQLLRDSTWIRSPVGGIAHLHVGCGEQIEKGQKVGFVCDVFGKNIGDIRSKTAGIVIATAQNPLVNRGDALLHVAWK